MDRTPGTDAYLHRRFLEALTSLDPVTHEFDPEEARVVAERVKQQVDLEISRSRLRNVLLFPTPPHAG